MGTYGTVFGGQRDDVQYILQYTESAVLYPVAILSYLWDSVSLFRQSVCK